MPSEEAFVGFGSNLGNSLEICMEAMRVLSKASGVSLQKVSSFYGSEPVGCRDQGWFINGALRIQTTLEPHALLTELLRIENLFGRERVKRRGPRTLDLDLLFHGDVILQSPVLTLPHPAICQRRFVLEPLAEIHPEKIHPVFSKSVSQLLREWKLRQEEQQIQRMDGICFAL